MTNRQLISMALYMAGLRSISPPRRRRKKRHLLYTMWLWWWWR